LVRASRPELRKKCADAELVMGHNWRSVAEVQLIAAQTLFSVRDGENGIEYVEGSSASSTEPKLNDDFREKSWGKARPLPGTNELGPGTQRRSWRIGFRCAFDVPTE
jgi:hypothetical protein